MYLVLTISCHQFDISICRACTDLFLTILIIAFLSLQYKGCFLLSLPSDYMKSLRIETVFPLCVLESKTWYLVSIQ